MTTLDDVYFGVFDVKNVEEDEYSFDILDREEENFDYSNEIVESLDNWKRSKRDAIADMELDIWRLIKVLPFDEDDMELVEGGLNFEAIKKEREYIIMKWLEKSYNKHPITIQSNASVLSKEDEEALYKQIFVLFRSGKFNQLDKLVSSSKLPLITPMIRPMLLNFYFDSTVDDNVKWTNLMNRSFVRQTALTLTHQEMPRKEKRVYAYLSSNLSVLLESCGDGFKNKLWAYLSTSLSQRLEKELEKIPESFIIENEFSLDDRSFKIDGTQTLNLGSIAEDLRSQLTLNFYETVMSYLIIYDFGSMFEYIYNQALKDALSHAELRLAVHMLLHLTSLIENFYESYTKLEFYARFLISRYVTQIETEYKPLYCSRLPDTESQEATLVEVLNTLPKEEDVKALLKTSCIKYKFNEEQVKQRYMDRLMTQKPLEVLISDEKGRASILDFDITESNERYNIEVIVENQTIQKINALCRSFLLKKNIKAVDQTLSIYGRRMEEEMETMDESDLQEFKHVALYLEFIKLYKSAKKSRYALK